jgi:hypothetical protein
MRYLVAAVCTLVLCGGTWADDPKGSVKKKFMSPLGKTEWKPTGGFAANGSHSAEDMVVPEGTPVHAIADGWLIYSYVSPSGGGTIGMMHQLKANTFVFSMYHHLRPRTDFPNQFAPRKMAFLKQGSLLGHVAPGKSHFGGTTNHFTHLHAGVNLDIGNQVASGVWKEPFWGIFKEGPNAKIHFIALTEVIDAEEPVKFLLEEKAGRTKDPIGYLAKRERASLTRK